jgi:hypothetical protein
MGAAAEGLDAAHRVAEETRRLAGIVRVVVTARLGHATSAHSH